jgi:hypothetical protein
VLQAIAKALISRVYGTGHPTFCDSVGGQAFQEAVGSEALHVKIKAMPFYDLIAMTNRKEGSRESHSSYNP